MGKDYGQGWTQVLTRKLLSNEEIKMVDEKNRWTQICETKFAKRWATQIGSGTEKTDSARGFVELLVFFCNPPQM